MAVKGGHLLSLCKSPPMDHIPPCSAVSITPVGETESSTQTSRRPSNFVRQDRLGLAGHCRCSPELPASQLVLWRVTHGHLRCTRSPSVYIHRNPDERGYGRIHQRTLIPLEQQSGLGSKATTVVRLRPLE